MPRARHRMEDFKWCVWLSPPDGHAWHGFIDQVPAHVSVAVYLDTEADARRVAGPLAETRALVRWNGPLVQTCTNGFYALSRTVESVTTSRSPNAWWPSDAHISFAYKYGCPFTSSEINSVERRLALRHHEAELSVCRIARATGHYRDWISEKVKRLPRET